DDEQLEILDGVSARRERLLELIERLGRVGAGVDQRERRVLDQVGVHAPDLEGSGDGESEDSGFLGPRQRRELAVALLRVIIAAHERISASTSSRRCSMSSRES